jgi:hypothetical protein
MNKLLSAFLIAAFVTSCNQSIEITYPENGAYGQNILALPNSSTYDLNDDFSMHALLHKKSKLKIVVTNLSESNPNQPMPAWFYEISVTNWKVSDYSNNTQVFTSVKGSNECDLWLTFSGINGSAKIDFYENSESITRTKCINW